jgi:hypothetical protein
MAFKSIKIFEEAVKYFRSAADVIQIRVENLKWVSVDWLVLEQRFYDKIWHHRRNSEPSLEPRQRITEITILETWLDEIEYEIVETIDEDKQIREFAEKRWCGKIS